jgi:5'-nucleotidase
VAHALEHGVAAATLLGRAAGPSRSATTCAWPSTAIRCCSPTRRSRSSRARGSTPSAGEAEAASRPLEGGPFKDFLGALHGLQQEFAGQHCPIRTALVTARSAPAHERVIRTLRAWDIRLDESLFLGGMEKTEFLRAFGADVFFDDQSQHCERARPHVTAGHVPHGIVNRATANKLYSPRSYNFHRVG